MVSVEKDLDSPFIQFMRFIHQVRYSLVVFIVAVTVVFTYIYVYAKQLRMDRLATINQDLHQKNFSGALVRTDTAIKSYPREVVFYVCKIQALAGLGRGDDALKELTGAEQIFPSNLDIVGMRAKLLADMGQLAPSLEEYRRLADDPVYGKSAQIQADKAIVELRMKKEHAAMTDIDRAIYLAPGEAKFYAIRARAAKSLNLYERAIKDATVVITTLDFARRAKGSAMQSDKAERIAVLLASLPNELPVYVLRAQSYEMLHDDAAAFEDYTKAVQSDPSRVDLYMARGNLSLRHNRYREAYADYRHIVEVEPHNAVARAKMNEVSKFFTPAQIAERTPPPPTFKKGDYIGMGYQDMVDNKLQDAIAEFTNAVVKDPNDFKARRYLAHCLAKTGDNRNAAKQFSILLDMHKLDYYDIERYAEALEGAGKSNEAAELYEKLVKMRPNDVDLYRSLGRVYSDTDQKRKAIEACAKGLKLAKSDSDINEFNRIIRDIQLDRQK